MVHSNDVRVRSWSLALLVEAKIKWKWPSSLSLWQYDSITELLRIKMHNVLHWNFHFVHARNADAILRIRYSALRNCAYVRRSKLLSSKHICGRDTAIASNEIRRGTRNQREMSLMQRTETQHLPFVIGLFYLLDCLQRCSTHTQASSITRRSVP